MATWAGSRATREAAGAVSDVRRLAGGVVEGFNRHDLLTYASAIAFQVMTALIPLAMFALALLGFLHLGDAWSRHLAPQLRQHASHEVYALVNQVALKALGAKRGFWLTAGALLAVWETSGAVRAVMGALSRVYGARERRSRTRRYLISFGLAVAAGVLIALAFTVVRFGPDVVHGLAVSILRWPVACAVLITAVWLLVRFAPGEPQPVGWVSAGSVLCVAAWLVTSVAFGLYAFRVASYQSLFASLAVLFVAMTYLYLSACAFLVGAMLDALLRRRETGSRSGR